MQKKIWPNLKRSKISETREAMPTKIDLHAFCINLYLHKIFELILFFDSMVQKGNLAINEESYISETREAMPTKIDLHAFHNHFYLHEFFDPILFFDPHGLVIFEGKRKRAKSPKPDGPCPPKLIIHGNYDTFDRIKQ